MKVDANRLRIEERIENTNFKLLVLCPFILKNYSCLCFIFCSPILLVSIIAGRDSTEFLIACDKKITSG